MKRITNTINFGSMASRPKQGLALIYDLEGFSAFFNQPDVQDYVPRFLNVVSDAISINIFGGQNYWSPPSRKKEVKISPLGKAPIHEKFMGDGAMYLWVEDKKEAFTPSFVYLLCNRLWNLKTHFNEVVRKSHDLVPVTDVPRRIRFGLARGTIYELTRKNSQQREYIGFCINLASRLQKYCPELGFIASARLGIPETELKKHRYIKVVAKQIKGFPREIVIVDRGEFERLSPETRDQYFEQLE